MAAVRIENDCWTSWKFILLGRLCGMPGGNVQAIAACAQIWSWQTDNFTPELPTYHVSRDLVETYLGPGAVDHLVRAELAREEPDGIYVRGSKGRIEWLYESRKNGSVGGRASQAKRGRRDKRRGVVQPPLEATLGGGVDQGVDQGVDPNANATAKTKAKREKRTPLPLELEIAQRALRVLSKHRGIEYQAVWNGRPTEAAMLVIRLLRDGYSDLDLRIVPAYLGSTSGKGWSDSEKMREYIRPETCFGPKKFPGYLPEARAWFAEQFPDGDPDQLQTEAA